MEKVLTLVNSLKYVRSSLVNDPNKGECFILYGTEGSGRNVLLNMISEAGKAEGFEVYRARTYSQNEIIKYQSFNEIINQIEKISKRRAMNEIIDFFYSLFDNTNERKILIIVDGIENMNESSKNLFLYLSRMTRRSNFKLIGSFEMNIERIGTSSQRFLDVIVSEDYLKIIALQKVGIEDFNFVLKHWKFKLPESFILELYRLVNGNIQFLTYVLAYYEEEGIINSNKELEEATYRFFPIPPRIEMYYTRFLHSLSDNELQLTLILAIIGGEVTPRFLANMLSMKEDSVEKYMKKAEKAGIVFRSDHNFSISSKNTSDFIIENVPKLRGKNLSPKISETNQFLELPILTRLRILFFMRDYSKIASILEKTWKDIVAESNSQDYLLEFLKEIQGRFDDNLNMIIDRLIFQSYFISGKYDEAIKSYNNLKLKEGDIEPRIFISNIYSRLGRDDESLLIADTLLKEKSLSEKDKSRILISKAETFYRTKKHNEADQAAKEALKIATEQKDEGLMAMAYNIMGNLAIEKFHLDEALSFYNKSMEINKRLRKWDQISRNLNNIAILKSFKGEFKDAIEIFKELIEDSYLTGNITTRAYAMYNITEIYHMIGDNDLCQSHIPQAIKLVSISNDKNLAYLFNRFLSIFYMENLDYAKSKAAIQEAISIAEFTKIPDRIALGRAILKVIDSIFTQTRDHDTDKLLTADYEINDEFLPIFYSISSIYFLINGEIDNYQISLQKGTEISDLVGDFYGSRLVEIARVLGLYLKREFKELESFLKTIPPPNTPVLLYNNVIISIQECLNYINTGERLKINDKISEFRPEGGLSTLIVQSIYLMADYLKNNNRDKFQLAINIIREAGLTTKLGINDGNSKGKK
ncbi:hypothetical protein OXIME_000905 [Oxyplasma meridianum]|uniref:Tetratricopeptide repeat protein n=1 Tax=Oxyplasma meridianum TaxID=3073602 RepID=A0AAX4NH60_9ARCH